MSKTSDFIDSMTSQEVFDFIVAHMEKQRCRSISIINGNKQCRYRTGSLSCAAGCLINDEDYCPSIEGMHWYTISNKLGITKHGRLISSMQICHDFSGDIKSMLSKFVSTAKNFDLDPSLAENAWRST